MKLRAAPAGQVKMDVLYPAVPTTWICHLAHPPRRSSNTRCATMWIGHKARDLATDWRRGLGLRKAMEVYSPALLLADRPDDDASTVVYLGWVSKARALIETTCIRGGLWRVYSIVATIKREREMREEDEGKKRARLSHQNKPP
jgi:hypothetical protein